MQQIINFQSSLVYMATTAQLNLFFLMQPNRSTLGFGGKHSMALIWGFENFSNLNYQQNLFSYINGDHDRWVNGEDLKFEYAYFTKDYGVRG